MAKKKFPYAPAVRPGGQARARLRGGRRWVVAAAVFGGVLGWGCVTRPVADGPRWTVRLVRTPPLEGGTPAPSAAAPPPGFAAGGRHAGRPELGEVGPFGPAPTDVLARALEAVVRSGRDAYLLPGVALALVRRDGTSFCGTYGWGGLPATGAAPVDADTLFAAAGLAAGPAVGGTQAAGPGADAPPSSASVSRGDPSGASAPAGVGAPASEVPACAGRAPAVRAKARVRRAVGHEVRLHRGEVEALGAQAAAPAAWCSVRDWAAALHGTLASSTGGTGGRGAVGGGAWQVAADVPGFVARVLCDPVRGVAWALLANAGAGPGADALVAELARTVADYTPRPTGDGPSPSGAGR